MNNAVRYKRLEDKYVITDSQFKEILAETRKHLKLYSYEGERATAYTVIKSTYMDSYDLMCFKKHINKDSNRSKARIRRYAPNGKLKPDYFIELKEKHDGEGLKSRMKIDRENLSEFRSGKSISLSPYLKKINNKINPVDLRILVGRLNTLVPGNRLRPILSTKYKRIAYGTNDFRITFDTELNWQAEQFKSRGEAQRIKDRLDWQDAKKLANRWEPGKVIMEIKHDGEIPKWLKTLLDKQGDIEDGFSKYDYSCFNMIEKLLEDK